MSKTDIKKGDNIIVISGKNKGRTGEVLEVLPAKVALTKAGLPRPRTSTGARFIIGGVNIVKHHEKKQGNEDAGIHEKEAPLTRAKIALLSAYKGKKPGTETTTADK
jgi:ribosomal protein L24